MYVSLVLQIFVHACNNKAEVTLTYLSFTAYL
jgi:hypothetical protein